jgi:hypothetical protein
MAQEPNIYDLYEKMGSTLNAVDKLNSELRRSETEQNKRHEENIKKFTDILEKLSDFKHEQANNEQKLTFEVHKVKEEIKNLKKPVDEIIAIRSRVGIILGFVLSIGGCVWFFLQPAWNFFSERWMGHLMGGGAQH